MRRAAVSVMSNVAEGFESRTPGLFIEFLGRARGSAGELRAQLYVALDRDYLTQDQFVAALRQAETCSRQIARLIHYLETQPVLSVRAFSRPISRIDLRDSNVALGPRITCP